MGKKRGFKRERRNTTREREKERKRQREQWGLGGMKDMCPCVKLQPHECRITSVLRSVCERESEREKGEGRGGVAGEKE